MIYGDSGQAIQDRPWPDFERWNVLFEALCSIRGFAAVNDLAHAYCGRTRGHTQRDLDAAARSINNWRSGSHAPSARNLAILAQILDVTSDPVLNEAWHTLYRKAKDQTEAVSGPPGAPPRDSSWTTTVFRGGRRHFVFIIAAAVVVAAFVSVLAAWHAGSQASETSQRPIPFRPKVILKVGQSAVIHGYRASCGKPAPDKDATTSRFPSKIEVGILAAGDIGVRYSRHCGGDTPAREVIFHSERVGSEKIELFGDVIAITVTP